VALAVLAGVALVSGFAVGAGDHHSSTTRGADGHATSRGTHADSPARPEVERRAVDRVLGYTSYISAGSPRKREVALTFDDGPGPYTPAILRILEREHVPATFFVVGQELNSFTSMLRQVLRAGFRSRTTPSATSCWASSARVSNVARSKTR
jgi:hypothetical protein